MTVRGWAGRRPCRAGWWLTAPRTCGRSWRAHSQEWADYLARCNRDGYGADGEGWWEDWAASFLPWGFDLAWLKAHI